MANKRSFVRIDLDARVESQDGQDVGTVHRVVIDPETNEITDFLISTGELFGRDILVPRELMEQATKEGNLLRLTLSKNALDDLPSYVPEQYVVPPPGWEPPAAYGFPIPGYLMPTGRDYPIRPVNPPAPPEGPRRVSIDKGAAVQDRDGHDVGVVDDVRFDPETGQVQGFVLRLGGVLVTMLGRGKTVEIPIELVDKIEEDIIHLRTNKDELGRGSAWR